MDFETIKFSMLGYDPEDGTTSESELNTRLQEAAKLVLDPNNGDCATVTAKIKVKRNDAGAVTFKPSIKLAPPERQRKSLAGIFDPETRTLQTTQHKQTDIADVLREAREESEPESRAEFRARKERESAKRREEGRPVESDVGQGENE